MHNRTSYILLDEVPESLQAIYKQARESVAPYLKDFVIMDAISSLAVCREGEIDCPVCSNDHMEPFLEAGVTPLWSYLLYSPGLSGQQPLHGHAVRQVPYLWCAGI